MRYPPRQAQRCQHRAGRHMELEALHGTVVRVAKRHEISVPAAEAIYALLGPWVILNGKSASRT